MSRENVPSWALLALMLGAAVLLAMILPGMAEMHQARLAGL